MSRSALHPKNGETSPFASKSLRGVSLSSESTGSDALLQKAHGGLRSGSAGVGNGSNYDGGSLNKNANSAGSSGMNNDSSRNNNGKHRDGLHSTFGNSGGGRKKPRRASQFSSTGGFQGNNSMSSRFGHTPNQDGSPPGGGDALGGGNLNASAAGLGMNAGKTKWASKTLTSAQRLARAAEATIKAAEEAAGKPLPSLREKKVSPSLPFLLFLFVRWLPGC